jgi:aspartate kinase
MKFGGTSVGTPEAMAQTVDIVRQAQADWPRLVVVTSALSGVTNLLLDSATRAARGENGKTLSTAEDRLRQIHRDMIEALVGSLGRRSQVRLEIDGMIGDFVNLCQAIGILGEATPRALDTVASLGERMSVRLLAAALQEKGANAQAVDASRLIITDRDFQNAHPDFEATRENTCQVLEPLLSQGAIPVITGFIGGTPEGITTTLGRGGSDYSAAILGAALPADEVWIWTDVDGVMSADPRLVAEARTIAELTYREIAELAYYGAKVLHPKTIRPVVEAGIGLRICNTFNPGHPGTRLVGDEAGSLDGKVKAVTAIRGQRLITIEGRGMLGVPGVAARSFGAVASTGTSVPLITQASSEQSICFAVPAESAERVISALEAAFASELSRRDIDRVWATDEVVIVTVVGSGMRQTPGVAGKVFSLLGQRRVNVIAIAQGSSEVSISLVVEGPDAEPAVRALHELTGMER